MTYANLTLQLYTPLGMKARKEEVENTDGQEIELSKKPLLDIAANAYIIPLVDNHAPLV